MRTILAILFIFSLAITASAQDIACSACSKKITGTYIQVNGKPYCGQACLKLTLPKCAVCKKSVGTKYYPYKGKSYCSTQCLSTLYPKCEHCGAKMKEWSSVGGRKFCQVCIKKPRCFECSLPVRKGLKFNDGRQVCGGCEKDLLTKEAQFKQTHLQARKELKTITGEITTTAPELKLGDLKQMMKLNGVKGKAEGNPRFRGFYYRTEEIAIGKDSRGNEVRRRTQLTRQIYLLYGMSPGNAITTAIHENTHDLMAEHYPATVKAPLWVQEGLAQYVAAIHARRKKMTLQINKIQNHPSADYGGGYRYFRKKFGDDNWSRVAMWLRATDVTKLPKKCPVK